MTTVGDAALGAAFHGAMMETPRARGKVGWGNCARSSAYMYTSKVYVHSVVSNEDSIRTQRETSQAK